LYTAKGDNLYTAQTTRLEHLQRRKRGRDVVDDVELRTLARDADFGGALPCKCCGRAQQFIFTLHAAVMGANQLSGGRPGLQAHATSIQP
jgi:hypothetical protein